jgi:glutaminyl-peptide cyclotransferase
MDTSSAPTVAEEPAPKLIAYDVTGEYPHDPAAFTEGLEYKDGFLYESTGEYGSSELRKTDLKTGKTVQRVKLDDAFFGEGITILNNKIYQLTYREHTGFVYDLQTFKKIRTFKFQASEGWGLTNNGCNLIFDDGTNVLHYLDTVDFHEVKTLPVKDNQGSVNEINELELINGFFYANVWKQDVILKIDTATGRVVAKTDLSNFRERTGIPQPSGRMGDPEVMNGIAFDKEHNRIFITGKYWSKLFEIKLDN